MISDYYNLETELIRLIEHRQKRESLSERDLLISTVITETFYFKKTFEEKIVFKETIEKLLFKYLNMCDDGEDGVGNAITFHLLYISMKVKIPIDNLLVDVFKNKSLINRSYEGRDLILTALQLFLDIPITYRTREELVRLISKEPFYRSKTSYCLHFLELFGRKEVYEGVLICLDAFWDLNINSSEIKAVASQFKSTFRVISPELLEKWYVWHTDNPDKISGNSLNLVLLRFVEISKGKDGFLKAEWISLLNTIQQYSNYYQPEIGIGIGAITSGMLEYFPYGVKIVAIRKLLIMIFFKNIIVSQLYLRNTKKSWRTLFITSKTLTIILKKTLLDFCKQPFLTTWKTLLIYLVKTRLIQIFK